MADYPLTEAEIDRACKCGIGLAIELRSFLDDMEEYKPGLLCTQGELCRIWAVARSCSLEALLESKDGADRTRPTARPST